MGTYTIPSPFAEISAYIFAAKVTLNAGNQCVVIGSDFLTARCNIFVLASRYVDNVLLVYLHAWKRDSLAREHTNFR